DRAGEAVRREVLRLRAVCPQPPSDSTLGRDGGPQPGQYLGSLQRPDEDPLSAPARRYFATLPGAGPPPRPSSGALTAATAVLGEAGSLGEGTWLRFHLLIERGVVKDA